MVPPKRPDLHGPEKIGLSPTASLAETCKAGTCSRKSIQKKFVLLKNIAIINYLEGQWAPTFLLFIFQDLPLESGPCHP
jgi:hypothetical protein